jgi:hypothetical protein
MAHTFMRSPEVVEQSLMASCGTTLGHARDGSPVLDEVRVDASQQAQIAEVQKGIETYLRLWTRHRGEGDARDAGQLRALYQAILVRSVARPLAIERELFGGWRHDENFGSASARGLSEPQGLGEWEVAHLSAHQLASLPMTRLHWPFGFASGLSPAMGDAVAHIFLRTADPSVFDSGHPPQVLIAYWDTGQGFRAEESSIQRYALNNRGRVWQRLTLRPEAGPARRVGFTIGLQDQVLQLTGIALRGQNGSGGEKVLRFTHEEIEKHGYAALGGGLYRVEMDPALLVVSAEGLGAARGAITIDLFFGLVLGT